jgi:hypothetical protein
MNNKNIVCYNRIFEVILDMYNHCSDAQYYSHTLSKVRGVFVNICSR